MSFYFEIIPSNNLVDIDLNYNATSIIRILDKCDFELFIGVGDIKRDIVIENPIKPNVFITYDLNNYSLFVSKDPRELFTEESLVIKDLTIDQFNRFDLLNKIHLVELLEALSSNYNYLKEKSLEILFYNKNNYKAIIRECINHIRPVVNTVMSNTDFIGYEVKYNKFYYFKRINLCRNVVSLMEKLSNSYKPELKNTYKDNELYTDYDEDLALNIPRLFEMSYSNVSVQVLISYLNNIIKMIIDENIKKDVNFPKLIFEIKECNEPEDKYNEFGHRFTVSISTAKNKIITYRDDSDNDGDDCSTTEFTKLWNSVLFEISKR